MLDKEENKQYPTWSSFPVYQTFSIAIREQRIDFLRVYIDWNTAVARAINHPYEKK